MVAFGERQRGIKRSVGASSPPLSMSHLLSPSINGHINLSSSSWRWVQPFAICSPHNQPPAPVCQAPAALMSPCFPPGAHIAVERRTAELRARTPRSMKRMLGVKECTGGREKTNKTQGYLHIVSYCTEVCSLHEFILHCRSALQAVVFLYPGATPVRCHAGFLLPFSWIYKKNGFSQRLKHFLLQVARAFRKQDTSICLSLLGDNYHRILISHL